MTAGAEITAIVNASRELLAQGDAEGAERVLKPVISRVSTDGATLHLMGLIKKAQNQVVEAERYFRKAVAHGLREGPYYNDLGVVLQARGEYVEAARVFRAAMALLPQITTVRANLVRCLLSAGDLAKAEEEARAYLAIEPGAESWTLLSQVHRAQERHDDALAAAEAALKYGRKLRGLRFNYAAALDRVGRGGEALQVYEQLAADDLDTQELALNFVRALYAAGRKTDAETVAERAVQQWPGSTVLHGALARIRWLRGEGEGCAAAMEAELLWRRPSDIALRMACADALHRGGHIEKALKALEEALRYAPENPVVMTAYAIMLDELDRPRDALSVLRRVAELAPTSRTAQRNMLSTLLRGGQPADALTITRALRVEEPDEQYLIACETTALRLLGDPDYPKLCDYDRLVRTYDIPAPRRHFTAESFNASLTEFLRNQHRVNAHPLDQTLSNGSQTGRNLLLAPDVILKAFMEAIDVAVRDYISRLPGDVAEPLVRRRGKHYRYGGLWSVRLMRDGYKPSHVHDRGWISAVYTAAVLPAERPRNPHNGWLKLGEPNRPPPRCGPERLIEPKVGQLVLFPSYFWQGVVPFEGDERLTAELMVTP
ncbi:MAG: tetratricopeptide repeat protein [Hyphomonadaceae bacterium]|nr:tetratricopeptide repeat protein [Hyphomonadaceae bacterium]